jgi:hypothetical protein
VSFGLLFMSFIYFFIVHLFSYLQLFLAIEGVVRVVGVVVVEVVVRVAVVRVAVVDSNLHRNKGRFFHKIRLRKYRSNHRRLEHMLHRSKDRYFHNNPEGQLIYHNMGWDYRSIG